MKIKQLEWKKSPLLGHRFAESPFGQVYYVDNSNFSKKVTIKDDEGWEIGSIPCEGTVEQAKAAAQADFEKRVMACFETTDKSNFWG
jgi:hypothetical protein